MKKTIAAMLTLVLLLVPTAKAVDFNFGIQGGVDFNHLSLKGDLLNNFKSQNTPGFFIGPKIHLGIVAGLGVNVAAEYNYSRFQFEGTKYNELTGEDTSVISDNVQHAIALPINLRYTIGLGKVGVFAEVGLEFDFSLGNNEFNISNGTFKKQNMSTYFNVGGGLRIWKLEAGAAYSFNIDKVGDTTLNWLDITPQNTTSLRHNSWHVHLTYYF